MNAITLEVFGWLSDDRIEQLRAEVKERKAEYPNFTATSLRAGINVEELDKILTELTARRLKDKKELAH